MHFSPCKISNTSTGSGPQYSRVLKNDREFALADAYRFLVINCSYNTYLIHMFGTIMCLLLIYCNKPVSILKKKEKTGSQKYEGQSINSDNDRIKQNL